MGLNYDSPNWKKASAECLLQYGYKCYICGSSTNLNTHHITYAHVGEEQPHELICLCHDCHMKVHECKDAIKNKAEFHTPTPKADAWYNEIKKEIESLRGWAIQTYNGMRDAEITMDSNIINELTSLYVDKLGNKTIKGHLPKIGAMLGETCGIERMGGFITRQISKKIKNK